MKKWDNQKLALKNDIYHWQFHSWICIQKNKKKKKLKQKFEELRTHHDVNSSIIYNSQGVKVK